MQRMLNEHLYEPPARFHMTRATSCLVMGLALGAGCRSLTQSAEVVGDKEVSHVATAPVMPDTVSGGQSFTVTFLTSRWDCGYSPWSMDVAVSGFRADVVPYDDTPGYGDCDYGGYTRSASVTFPPVSTLTSALVVVHSSVGGGFRTPQFFSQSVVVVP